MRRLLEIELQKLLLNRTSKILIFISFILPLCVILLSALKINFFGFFTLELGELGIFNFPIIWHITTFFSALFKFFFAIVVVSMIGNEYSNKTLKQNLIDGLSKKEFILSKFLAVLLFSVISSVVLFVVTLTLGMVFSDFTEISIVFTDLQYMLGYFIKVTTFFSMCMFLGIWIKRSAFALGFLGVWQVFEGFIFIVFSYLKNKKDINLIDNVYNLLPLNAMSDLIAEPFTRLGAVQTLASQVGESFDKSYDVPWHSALICLVWTTLFVYWSYLILKRRDL